MTWFEVISQFGILFVVLRLVFQWMHQVKTHLLESFTTVCTTPAPYIASYKDAYDDVFSFYMTQGLNPNQHDEYVVTDHIYLDKILYLNVGDHDFPVITKSEYLLSRSENFNVTLDAAGLSPEPPDVAICDGSRKFLQYFNIRDLLSFLITKGCRVWNAATFELAELNKNNNNGVKLSFQIGSYSKYINNNEILLREVYFHRHVSPKKWWQFRISRFIFPIPRKNTIRKKVPFSDIFNFTNRHTCLGVSAFVVMAKPENKYCTFIQKRNKNQVEYPGCYHVAPAGTFQPLSEFDADTIRKQCSLEFTVLREFLEEVFNLEEADKGAAVDPFDIFKLRIERAGQPAFCPGEMLGISTSPNGILLDSSRCEIIPTSFSIDLMTLKPHVSCVLWIKTPELYNMADTAFNGNWEGAVKEFELGTMDAKNEFNEFVATNLNINSFPPVGAITLAEGLSWFWDMG